MASNPPQIGYSAYQAAVRERYEAKNQDLSVYRIPRGEPKNVLNWGFVMSIVERLFVRQVIVGFDFWYVWDKGYTVYVELPGSEDAYRDYDDFAEDFYSCYYDSPLLAAAHAVITMLKILPEDQRKAVLA